MSRDALSVRMKAHEHVTRQVLPRRVWTLIRLDGRSFHTYTRGLERPFDADFAADMDAVAVAVVSEVAGAAFAYVQSDEISVLATDFATPDTEPWFGGVTAKILSISAAVASVTMNQRRPPAETNKTALFDSRVFTLADPREVAAYFVWRQRDAVKNSISMAAQSHFSAKRLHGLHSGALQELLLSEAQVDWNDYPAGFRHGRVIVKEPYSEPVTFTHKRTGVTHTQTVDRTRWVSRPAPPFTTEPDGWLLGQAVPTVPLPSRL